eukprot:TRINITY_DN1012_c1_g1_i4.p1 TRINITY_DN1012_c1_g1~~TRINITY_DN1012_c1_g1_i4.p1  ORF type:complete len:569 (+),score=273.38 TRINITY_DN1012_c1_g1_i4:184-1890(+)
MASEVQIFQIDASLLFPNPVNPQEWKKFAEEPALVELLFDKETKGSRLLIYSGGEFPVNTFVSEDLQYSVSGDLFHMFLFGAQYWALEFLSVADAQTMWVYIQHVLAGTIEAHLPTSSTAPLQEGISQEEVAPSTPIAPEGETVSAKEQEKSQVQETATMKPEEEKNVNDSSLSPSPSPASAPVFVPEDGKHPTTMETESESCSPTLETKVSGKKIEEKAQEESCDIENQQNATTLPAPIPIRSTKTVEEEGCDHVEDEADDVEADGEDADNDDESSSSKKKKGKKGKKGKKTKKKKVSLAFLTSQWAETAAKEEQEPAVVAPQASVFQSADQSKKESMQDDKSKGKDIVPEKETQKEDPEKQRAKKWEDFEKKLAHQKKSSDESPSTPEGEPENPFLAALRKRRKEIKKTDHSGEQEKPNPSLSAKMREEEEQKKKKAEEERKKKEEEEEAARIRLAKEEEERKKKKEEEEAERIRLAKEEEERKKKKEEEEAERIRLAKEEEERKKKKEEEEAERIRLAKEEEERKKKKEEEEAERIRLGKKKLKWNPTWEKLVERRSRKKNWARC